MGERSEDDGRCAGTVECPNPDGGTWPIRCGRDEGHDGPCSPSIEQFSRWNTLRLMRRGY